MGERFEDATLLGLKTEEGATSQGSEWSLKKARKQILPLYLQEGLTPADILILFQRDALLLLFFFNLFMFCSCFETRSHSVA